MPSRSRAKRCAARANVEGLIDRLITLGFAFKGAHLVFVPTSSDDLPRLDAIEDRIGALPLSIRAWYEHVGTICLRGEHPQLTLFMSDWADQHSIYPDPLKFLCPPPYVFALYDEWIENHADMPDASTEDEPFVIEFSGAAYHKAGVSGGPPYGIAIPDAAADAIIRDFWRETTFVAYLRDAFAWGGFPGFARYPDYPREQIDFLRDGLLPL